MNARLHKISLGVAASVAILAAIPTANAGNGKYGSIYAVDPYGTVVRDPYGKCIRTPQWTPEKEHPDCGGQVAKVEPPAPVHKEISLGADALFDFDKATLRPAGRAKLDELVSDMRQLDSLESITVVGHTDPLGTDAYNMRLSDRRAHSVASYLAGQGVPADRIRAEGRGETDLKVTPEECRGSKGRKALIECYQPNRRVDITVDGTQKAAQ